MSGTRTSPMAAPDALFARFRDVGDPAALGALFDATSGELFRLALTLAPDAASAEDAVQETFLAAMAFAPRWDPSRPVVPWLVGILRHKVEDARRRERRAPDPRRLPVPVAIPDPASEAERREREALVQAEIERLPEPFRTAALARWRYGLEPAEIAHLTGERPGTVRVTLHRALERLRRRLRSLPALLLLVRGRERIPRGLASVREEVVRGAAAGAAAAALAGGGIMATKAAAGMAAAAVLLLGGILAWRTAGGGAEGGTDPLRVGTGPAEVAGGKVARAPAEAPAVDPPVEEPPVTGPRATGRVVDGAGSPVPGAAVRSWPRDESHLLDPGAEEGEGMARALTGADGSFIVPLRGERVLHDLVATAPGFAPRPFEGVRDGDAVVVVLESAVRILGRVLDPEGRPVPGARVTAVISLPGRVLARREMGSDGRGEFLLDACGAVPGRTGRAGGATLRVAAAGFAPALAEVPFVDAVPGAEVPLDITLSRGAALTVTVGEAESGAPVDGATVAWGTVAVPTPVSTENRNTAAFDPPAGTLGEAVTGPDGRAVFPHAAIGESLSIFVRAWKPGCTAEAVEIRPAGGGPAEARVTLHPAVEVRGRVMDEAGRPIPGATVTPSPAAPDWFPSPLGDRPPHGCATTDADGKYVLPGVRAAAGEGLEVTLGARPPYEGIAGPWTWGAAVRRGPYRVVLRTVPGTPVEAPDLVLPAGEEAPGVRLLVVDAGGRPIPGVSVAGQGSLLRFLVTDAEGRAEVRWHTDPSLLGFSQGGRERTLRLERRGFGGCTLKVVPATGELPEVRANLEPGRILAGRVEGRYDPSWNTWVSVFMGGEERPAYSTSRTLGSDGSFRFEDLPGGPFTVVAGTVHPDTEEEVRVSLGAVEAGREDLLLTLPPDPLPRGRVEGRVLDGRTGLVVPVFSVEVLGPSPRSPRTDGGRATGGRFSLPLVPEGDWVARVSARNYLEERVEVRVRGGAVARLDVRLAKGAALKGTARDPEGKPLTTGWMVRLIPREGGAEGFCWVGESGALEVAGLRPGAYTVCAFRPGPRREGSLASPPGFEVRVAPSDEVVTVDPPLLPAGRLAVETGPPVELPDGVRDEAAAVAATGKGARVEVREEGGALRAVRDGFLQGVPQEFVLPPGKYAVTLRLADGTVREEEVVVRP